jgi:serine/threonine protein kinase
MVIEYCNGGNLSDQILKKKKIPEAEAIDIIKQIIIGLSALH